MSADQPYTEADVELLAPVLEKARTVVFTDSDGYPSLAFADGEDLARAALDALAAAGRLLPEGARPADCGCPITVEAATITRHTRECGEKKAAARLAAHIADYYESTDG